MGPGRLLFAFVVASLVAGGLVAQASPSGSFEQTTCSGVVYTPPAQEGTYNVSVYDSCSKSIRSVLVNVQCYARIPSANFSLSVTQSWSRSGSSQAGVTVVGKVCTDRTNLEVNWEAVRGVTSYYYYSSSYSYDVNIDDHAYSDDSTEFTADIYFPTDVLGTHQIQWTLYDGCNIYKFPLALHYDGRRGRVVPSLPITDVTEIEEFNSYNRDCSLDRETLSIEGGLASMLEGPGNNPYFPDLWAGAVASVGVHNDLPAPTRNTLSYTWELTPSSDKVIIYQYGFDQDENQEYLIAPRSAFADMPDWLAAFDSGITSFHETDDETYYNEYSDSSVNPSTSYPYDTGRNRGNATFWAGNTRGVIRNSENRYARSWSNYHMAGRQRANIDTSLLSGSKIPVCRIVISPNDNWAEWSVVQVEGSVYNTGVTWDAAAACQGAYNLTVTASVNKTCTVSTTQAVHFTCNFRPDVLLAPDTVRAITVDYSSKTAQTTLKAYIRPPYSSQYNPLVKWEVISSPANSVWSLTSASTTSTQGTIIFSANLPGPYKINVTVSNGCQSTWVVETIDVSCSQTALPTITAFTVPAAAVAYLPTYAKNGIWAGSSPASVVLGGTTPLAFPASTVFYYTVVPPAGLADKTGAIINSGTSMQVYGAGTYKLTGYLTHGCGQLESQTKDIAVTCDTPVAWTVSDFQQDVKLMTFNSAGTTLKGKYWNVALQVNSGNTYSPPVSYGGSWFLRHTWKPVSERGVAYNATAAPLVALVNGVNLLQQVVTPTSNGQWQLYGAGDYVFTYTMDDGCASKQATLTVRATCVATTISIDPLPLTTVKAGESVTLSMTKTETDHVGTCKWTFALGGKVLTDETYSDYWCNTYTPSFSTPGEYTVTLNYTNSCDQSTIATKTFTVTCDTLVGNVVVHQRDNANPETTTVTFTNGRFPQVFINATTSTIAGERITSGAGGYMVVNVVSAPPRSIYSFMDEVDEDDYMSDDENTDMEHEGLYISRVYQVEEHQKVSKYIRLSTGFNGFSAHFTPDVPGEYKFNVTVGSGCATNFRVVTITAACNTGETAVYIDNEKQTQVASSAQFATNVIPGVSAGLTARGKNDMMVLNATRSMIAGSKAYLYYHWYWLASTNEDGDFDHSGLQTPFSPVLTLDLKTFQFNNRPLMVTVSDGCTYATAAVRINTGCSSGAINLVADKTTVYIDPTKTSVFDQCARKVKIHTGGVCIDGREFQDEVVEGTNNGAFITAAESYMSTFAVKTEEDDDDKALALGLGLGLGLPLLILLIVGFVYFKNRGSVKNKQVLPSNVEPVKTGSVELA